MISEQKIWGRSDSGVLVPVGRVSDTSSRSRSNYSQIRHKAREIEKIYLEAGIRLPTNSELGLMVQNTEELWEKWFLGNRENVSYKVFFLGMHLDRIGDAVIPLRDLLSKTDLKRLLSGSLNFFSREKSNAKDAFWELEVCSKLRNRKADASLREPPDVVVEYETSRIGIACKKLYSEGHVQNVLSQAVKQIEKEFDFGIVAINLDDLLPEDVVLKRGSSEAVSKRLLEINERFLRVHERHFRKYLSKGRLISAIVSTSMIADVLTERPQFRNTYQWTIWTIPGLDSKYSAQVEKFYQTVMGGR